jgi:hypothetical protein
VHRLDGIIDALASVLGKAQVVVGAEINGAHFLARVLERSIQGAVEFATDKVEHGAGTAADGTIPAIPQPAEEVPSVEILFGLEQRRMTLPAAEMNVSEESREWRFESGGKSTSWHTKAGSSSDRPVTTESQEVKLRKWASRMPKMNA